MVTMAGCTRRRAQISANYQRLVVDAFVVLRKLIGWDFVCAHVAGVGMAVSAGIGYVNRVNSRSRVTGSANIVDAVAVGTNGDFDVASGQPLAMHAGLVLAELIGAQAGIELPHVCGIRVATSAQLRDLFAIDLALPSGFAAHCLIWIIFRGIAAVAAGARQALLRVDVVAEFFLAHAQRIS